MKSPKILVDAICTDLQYVAPSYFGAQAIARNIEPNKFVWVPTDINTTGASDLGSDPPSIATDSHTFEIVCHGKIYEACIAMRAALLTACRKEVEGARVEISSSRFEHDSAAMRGMFLIVNANVILPLPQVTYPSETTADEPNVSVLEDTLEEIDLDGYAVDPAKIASTDGDGYLDANE